MSLLAVFAILRSVEFMFPISLFTTASKYAIIKLQTSKWRCDYVNRTEYKEIQKGNGLYAT